MKNARKTAEENIQSMSVIINIQMMQERIYGKSFEYNQFNGNTLDELYDLQNKMIEIYNNHLRTINS